MGPPVVEIYLCSLCGTIAFATGLDDGYDVTRKLCPACQKKAPVFSKPAESVHEPDGYNAGKPPG